ncbi:MAG: hypothetical protein J6Q19_08345 [Bacteroidaceae bacterium]|nr:hypothetical protein [Bacteroidaceae bacterium]
MKKTILFSLITVAAMVISSCDKENSLVGTDGENRTHQVILNAFNSDTKTTIIPVSGGYLSAWEEQDYITLHEHNTSIEDSDVEDYYSEELTASDIVDGKASFKVELYTDEQSEDEYAYVATYSPWSYAYINRWENAESSEYQSWSEMFDYTGEYLNPHFLIELGFNDYQSPTSAMFDSEADLLVSKPVITTGQMEGEVALQFARLGTIVKITVAGLDDFKGKAINQVIFKPGMSFSKSMNIVYDYVLEKYVHMEAMVPSGDFEDMPRNAEFTIIPEEICVKDDGTADLWIRTYSGELNDEFSIDLFIESEDGEINLRRKVNLAAENKSIIFNEGGMTEFSVGGWEVADVEPVVCEISVNDAKNGFTAIWNAVDNAIGYDCYLTGYAGEFDEDGNPEIEYEATPCTAIDNGDGTWSVVVESGLEPMNYFLHIKPVPADGHCLVFDEYSTFEKKVGLPEVWWFAHDCFGSSESEYIEGTDNEYIIDFSPGKVRFKNLERAYDYSWQVLKSTGSWYMYSTEPLEKLHSIEVYSKNDSHLNFKVYASNSPNELSEELEGVVVEVSEIDAGGGNYHYQAVHKKVRYTFPEDKTYQYYTICGDNAEIVMTSQYTYVYYFE